jgi:hypothetical protein
LQFSQRPAGWLDRAGGDSVVEEVTKEVALLLAGVEEEEKPMPVMVLEHDEDVGAWAEAIRYWLKRQGLEDAKIVQLEHGTGLSVVKLWVAGLLGGLGLEQRGGFYDGAGVAITGKVSSEKGRRMGKIALSERWKIGN